MYNFNYEEAGDKNHFCFYTVLRRSIKVKANGQGWVERCRCGRYKLVDCKYVVDGSNSPQITISWFDSDGKPSRKAKKVA